jgi:hypothetical protein
MAVRRVFRTRAFSKWMRKTALSDHALYEAVIEMEQGLVDADLGGGVVKKRVALPGRGKSRSVRTLVATNRDDHWFFMHGFAKNERANISARELEALQNLAEDLLKLSLKQIDAGVESNTLQEVHRDHED